MTENQILKYKQSLRKNVLFISGHSFSALDIPRQDDRDLDIKSRVLPRGIEFFRGEKAKEDAGEE